MNEKKRVRWNITNWLITNQDREFDYSYLSDLCNCLDENGIAINSNGWFPPNYTDYIHKTPPKPLAERINSFDIECIKRLIILIPLFYYRTYSLGKSARTSYGFKHDLEKIQENIFRMDCLKDLNLNNYVSNGDCIIAFLYLGYRITFDHVSTPNVFIYCKGIKNYNLNRL